MLISRQPSDAFWLAFPKFFWRLLRNKGTEQPRTGIWLAGRIAGGKGQAVAPFLHSSHAGTTFPSSLEINRNSESSLDVRNAVLSSCVSP